jgi:hypothetical protein
LSAVLISILLIHGWYDPECCSNKDCHPVPCEQIRRDQHDNFLWHRGPNDDVFFVKSRMKMSQDDSCHVCVLENAGLCIYLAPQT